MQNMDHDCDILELFCCRIDPCVLDLFCSFMYNVTHTINSPTCLKKYPYAMPFGSAHSVKVSKVHRVEMYGSMRFGDFTSCMLYSMNIIDGIFVTFIRIC
jgi:hypothetical protein